MLFLKVFVNIKLCNDEKEQNEIFCYSNNYDFVPLPFRYCFWVSVTDRYRFWTNVIQGWPALRTVPQHYRTLPSVTKRYRTLPNVTERYRTLHIIIFKTLEMNSFIYNLFFNMKSI